MTDAEIVHILTLPLTDRPRELARLLTVNVGLRCAAEITEHQENTPRLVKLMKLHDLLKEEYGSLR